MWVAATPHFKINILDIFEVTAHFLHILHEAFLDVLASGESPYGIKRRYRKH